MLLIAKKQIEQLDEVYFDSFLKKLLNKYRNDETDDFISEEDLLDWIDEAFQFNIKNEMEVEKYIDLKVNHKIMRQEPLVNWILYYLTHTGMTNIEKIEAIFEKLKSNQNG
jgi:hypothetical protein